MHTMPSVLEDKRDWNRRRTHTEEGEGQVVKIRVDVFRWGEERDRGKNERDSSLNDVTDSPALLEYSHSGWIRLITNQCVV